MLRNRNWVTLENFILEAGEVAQWLGVFAALSEDPHSSPSTHVRQLATTCSSRSGDPTTQRPLLASMFTILMCKCIYTQKLKFQMKIV